MGLEHVETIVADNQSAVNFTNVFDDSADRYLLFLDNIAMTESGGVDIRLSSNGGSTWDSGTSDYAHSMHRVLDSGDTHTHGESGNGEMSSVVQSGPSASDGDTAMGAVTIHDPSNSQRATVLRARCTFHIQEWQDSFRVSMFGGQRLTQSSIDSIRLFVTDGVISSGIFSVYKVTQQRGSAKQHIQTIEADNQSTVDFTEVFDQNDGFDRYQIYADNVVPDENTTRLSARMSSDGASTWDNSSSDYAWSSFVVEQDGGTATAASDSDDKIERLSWSSGNDPDNNDGLSSTVFVSQPTNVNRATVVRASGVGHRNSASDPFHTFYAGGIRLTQSAIDSIQFFMDSGDIASGTFSVYGIGR